MLVDDAGQLFDRSAERQPEPFPAPPSKCASIEPPTFASHSALHTSISPQYHNNARSTFCTLMYMIHTSSRRTWVYKTARSRIQVDNIAWMHRSSTHTRSTPKWSTNSWQRLTIMWQILWNRRVGFRESMKIMPKGRALEYVAQTG